MAHVPTTWGTISRDIITQILNMLYFFKTWNALQQGDSTQSGSDDDKNTEVKHVS